MNTFVEVLGYPGIAFMCFILLIPVLALIAESKSKYAQLIIKVWIKFYKSVMYLVGFFLLLLVVIGIGSSVFEYAIEDTGPFFITITYILLYTCGAYHYVEFRNGIHTVGDVLMLVVGLMFFPIVALIKGVVALCGVKL